MTVRVLIMWRMGFTDECRCPRSTANLGGDDSHSSREEVESSVVQAFVTTSL